MGVDMWDGAASRYTDLAGDQVGIQVAREHAGG